MNIDLKLALDASKEAGKIIMQYYRADYEIKEKGYHNPVTTADNEADSFLKSTLTDAMPEYGWLSEETVDSKDRLDKDRVWIVDPLDGTKEFINKTDEFTVNIALINNKKAVFGIVAAPVSGRTWIGSVFDNNSYELKRAARDVLVEFAKYLDVNNSLIIEINGFTDNIGDRLDNQLLSENRARAVRNLILLEGVDERRVFYNGFGESFPISTNETKSGRANNRRTEFKILEK